MAEAGRETNASGEGAGATTAGLAARAALAGRLGGVRIEDVGDLALVAVALPSPADRLRAPEAPTGTGSTDDGDPARTADADAPAATPDGRRRDGAPTDTAGGRSAGDGPVRARLERAFGTALPAMGRSALGTDGERLLGLHADRLFVLFAPADGAEAADPERAVAARLDGALGSDATGGDAGERERDVQGPWLADQSDAWVMLRLAGPDRRDVLERLCPIDLHPTVFPVGAVARTVFEHLATIVLNESEDAFLLLSPRSSARSFLHELETAAASAAAP